MFSTQTRNARPRAKKHKYWYILVRYFVFICAIVSFRFFALFGINKIKIKKYLKVEEKHGKKKTKIKKKAK